MFEARLTTGSTLKKIVESIKDLVTEVNFDCNQSGISMQAMDSSHVSLVTLMLKADGFEHYRCDHSFSLGINVGALAKVIKCANNDDIVTLKHEDGSDSITFMFENKNSDKISDFELKLMDIDAEHLGIPDTEYEAVIKMPSSDFQRVCRDMSMFGDTITVEATKEGVKFSVDGETKCNITLRPNQADKEDDSVGIEIIEPVKLAFALRYMNNFAKGTALAPQVSLSLCKDVPLAVEFKIPDLGHLRYFLAPKIDE